MPLLIPPKTANPSTAKDRPNNEIVFLPGWPAYRTRPGRTGLDYIDTQIEMAHMTGLFVRQLVTGDWLRSPKGVNPLVVLILGTTMILASPVGSLVCLAAPVLLVIGVIVMMRNGEAFQEDEGPDERAELAWEKSKDWITEYDGSATQFYILGGSLNALSNTLKDLRDWTVLKSFSVIFANGDVLEQEASDQNLDALSEQFRNKVILEAKISCTYLMDGSSLELLLFIESDDQAAVEMEVVWWSDQLFIKKESPLNRFHEFFGFVVSIQNTLEAKSLYLSPETQDRPGEKNNSWIKV